VGVLVAERTVDVAPRVSGLITQVKVRPGGHVKAGAVLATLDARALTQQMALALAEERKESDRAGRRQKLFEASLASKEEAETERWESQAKLARLGEARVRVDEAMLRAPFDGTVVGRFVEPGTLVAAGAPSIRVVSTGKPILRFGVSPEEARTLPVGSVVSFRDASSCDDAHYRARVVNVSSEVDRTVERIVVDAEADDEPAHFRSGRRVRVS